MLGLEHTHQPEIQIPEIMETFGEVARLNAMMEGAYYIGAAEYQRDELIHDIASKLVGRRVEVTELAIPAGASRPIRSYYDAGNEDRLLWAIDEKRARMVRSYPESQTAWYPNRFIRYRRVSTGKVDGVEGEGASLVIRPHGYRRQQRDFASMAGPTGEPRVLLRVI